MVILNKALNAQNLKNCFKASALITRINITVLPLAAFSINQFNWKTAQSIYDFDAIDIKGKNTSLKKYKDFVCVIVNVASN